MSDDHESRLRTVEQELGKTQVTLDKLDEHHRAALARIDDRHHQAVKEVRKSHSETTERLEKLITDNRDWIREHALALDGSNEYPGLKTKTAKHEATLERHNKYFWWGFTSAWTAIAGLAAKVMGFFQRG